MIKQLFDKASRTFSITKNLKYDRYERGPASIVNKFFDKISDSIHPKTGILADAVPDNQQLVKQLLKPVIKKFKKREVYSFFKNNTRGVDLVDMQLISE